MSTNFSDEMNMDIENVRPDQANTSSFGGGSPMSGSARVKSWGSLASLGSRSLAAIAAAALLLGAVACGSGEKSAGSDGKVETVTAVTATRSTIPDLYEAGGVVQSRTLSVLASKLMGNVIAVNVNEGDRVHRGQVLVEIDGRDVAAQVAQARAGVQQVESAVVGAESAVIAAQANADLATKTHARFVALKERNSISDQEFDEVDTRYKAALAQLEMAKQGREQAIAQRAQAKGALAQAEAARSWASITSPIDGVVTARLVDPGDQAAPGRPLVQVEDPTSFRVDVNVGESQVSRIKVGSEVGIRIDSIDRNLQGRIAQIAPAIDPAVRSFLVKIDVPANSEAGLRSGLFARAMIPVGEKEGVLLPARAVKRSGQLTSVLIVDGESIARLRLVSIGRTLGDQVEVLSGLNGGENVIVGGDASIADGTTVAVGEHTEAR